MSATLVAILMHVQVLVPFNKDYQPEQGVLVFAEIPPSTRLSLSVVKGNNGVTAKANVRWRF